jgi:endogenous inhibitor of DNA gyrase (YacG/DUF329 family)
MGRGKSRDSRQKAPVVRLRPPRKCPICGKDATQADYPFCSPRCADIDLNRWLSGAYAIPAVETEKGTEPGDDEE